MSSPVTGWLATCWMGESVPLGLVLVGQPAAAIDPAQQLVDARMLTQRARDSGFEHIAVGQHHLGAPYQYLHAIPLLTHLVAESGQMRLVTGVLLLPLLQPVDLADQLATLDVISNGRLVVGFGLGYRDVEMQAFGIQRRERGERLLEALQLLRVLWSGQRVDHDGAYFHVHAEGASLRPLQQPTPPIWLAAMSPVTLDRAARLGVLPFIGPRVSSQDVSVWVQAHRRAVGDAHASVPLRRELFVADNRQRAWEQAQACIGERFDAYRAWGFERGLAADSVADLRAYLADRVIVGDPHECADKLAEYRAMGAAPIMLRCQWPGLDVADSASMVDLVGSTRMA
jgi:alkanesulfonate monooxygenase SsuD/methylene tetrahydromethanopterin reductase-like flavin-dependent oxidoreductase (luciferase family)